MPSAASEPTSSLYNKTDLYDESGGGLKIQYPTWFVVTLVLSGVVTFALTGFLGWPQDTTGFASIFHQAWLLFLLSCVVLITIFASIFRDKSLRGKLIASLIVTALAIVLVGVTYFGQSLPAIIRQLLDQHKLLVALAQSKFTYTAINFGLLVIFWGDTIRRWVVRARDQTPMPTRETGLDSAGRVSAAGQPTLQELISGDLIAASVLTLLLAGLFWVNFLPQFVHPVAANGVAVSINGCTLSLPTGHCALSGGTVTDPPTLTFLDLFQSLAYLPLGLLVLALSATLSGFGAVEGVNDEAFGETDPQPALDKPAAAVPIAEGVATTVIDTLRAALYRRLRLLGSSIWFTLRTIAWPCLIIVGIYALASLSTNIEGYLHSARGLQANETFAIPVAIWGAVALVVTVAAPALMLSHWHVAKNTLQFLRLIGFIMLLTFWIFSLALLGIDRLLNVTGATQEYRKPFWPPSLPTYISFGALMIFGIILLLRRGDRGQATAASVTGRATQSSGEVGAPARH